MRRMDAQTKRIPPSKVAKRVYPAERQARKGAVPIRKDAP